MYIFPVYDNISFCSIDILVSETRASRNFYSLATNFHRDAITIYLLRSIFLQPQHSGRSPMLDNVAGQCIEISHVSFIRCIMMQLNVFTPIKGSFWTSIVLHVRSDYWFRYWYHLGTYVSDRYSIELFSSCKSTVILLCQEVTITATNCRKLFSRRQVGFHASFLYLFRK